MTVGELIEELNKFNPDREIAIRDTSHSINVIVDIPKLEYVVYAGPDFEADYFRDPRKQGKQIVVIQA